MLRIGVCDNVKDCVEEVAAGIEGWALSRNMNVQIVKFESGEEILFDLENAGDFAAVFMDIELSGINGLETAAKIRKQNRLVSIVFVSGQKRYFNQMFEIFPFQYIEKPVKKPKVCEALDHILEEQRLLYESFSFRYNRKTFNICLGEVLYFVSDKRRIRVFMEDGREYVFYEKLDVLEKTLSAYNNRFLRIHKSYLVNNGQIEQSYAKSVTMRNGHVLPVSRERKWVIGQKITSAGTICYKVRNDG